MTKWILTVLTTLIIFYIIAVPPVPGVMDQGDFVRLIIPSGLSRTAVDINSPNDRYMVKLVDEFKVKNFFIPAFTPAYPIFLIGRICKALGINYNTIYLSFFYSLILIALTFGLLKYFEKRISSVLMIIIWAVCVFIILNGDNLVWFNSLYCEGTLFLGSVLFLASAVYTVQSKSCNMIAPLVFAAFIMLCSKSQMFISIIPVLAIIMVLSRYVSGDIKNKKQYYALVSVLMALLVCINAVLFYYTQFMYSEYTIYQSLFTGVLKTSANPEESLSQLGLNKSLVKDMGKDAFDPSKSYYCPPRSKKAKEMIYSKIGSFDILKYYLIHPVQLYSMLDYTAQNSESTYSKLFIYKGERSDDKYREKVSRFDLWSSVRRIFAPKSFIGYFLIYAVLLSYSILKLLKSQKNSKEFVCWFIYIMIMLIGITQYPLSFLGNGTCDTQKQLFSFIIFHDFTILAAICYLITRIPFLKGRELA